MNELNYGVGLYLDGAFFFTNPTKADFTVLWNNKAYTFKAKTTVPLIIANEPPENVQAIRRKFAFKLAQREFHNSKRYKDLVKAGGERPATYNEDDEFMETIQSCLTALPKSNLEVTELPKDAETNYSSKAIKSGQDLNKAFEDYSIPELGAMS